MRVGVYVDAYNLYYGARDLCGRSTPGWRWLDIIGLVEKKIAARSDWGKSIVTTLSYCTALRETDGDSSSARDQRTYIGALVNDARFRVEYGQYNPKLAMGLLAKPGRRGKKGRIDRVVSPGTGNIPGWLPAVEKKRPEGEVNLLVNVATFEEKGSDVNVASRLLEDMCLKRIDAAVVVSNDGDLRLPLQIARHRIPVAVLNPSRRPTSAMLQGDKTDGVGRHWWLRLAKDDFLEHQLPPLVGQHQKPQGW